jgi:hypothetical protein
MKNKCLRGGGRRLSVRAVKGAGVGRSSERSEDPSTGEAGGAGAGFSQEGIGRRTFVEVVKTGLLILVNRGADRSAGALGLGMSRRSYRLAI